MLLDYSTMHPGFTSKCSDCNGLLPDYQKDRIPVKLSIDKQTQKESEELTVNTDIFSGSADFSFDFHADDSSADLAVRNTEKKDRNDDTVKIKTACRACISNCGVVATVKNGRVVHLEGNPEDPMSKGRMCAKGLSGIQALYNPNRNKYPLIRVGERGENRWKRISWDEAINIIADKLMEARRDYGAESVFCSTGGGGNPEFWSISRFCNIFGTPNWFEPGCAQCYLPRMAVYQMMYGGTNASIADSNAQEIYFAKDTKMKCLCLWGADPSYSSPACGGGAVCDLRAAGVKTVVIDPRMTPDAAKADVWLQLRPGSDVALQLAWIRYIIENRLYNHDFVLRWTNLPYLVNTRTGLLFRAAVSNDSRTPDTFMVWDQNSGSAAPLPYPWDESLDPALEGTFVIDGETYKTGFTLLKERVEEYTLKKAAALCWLPEDLIEKAIRTFCENTPGGLCIGVATDQSPNSAQAAMAACIIDLLMGNVEQPGSLLQRFGTAGATNMIGYCVPPAPSRLPDEQLKKRLGGNEYKGLHMWLAGHAPSILQAIETGKPYPLRVWLERSGNKLVNVADAKRWAEASKKVPFIVHMYMYPTSFSAYADMLLPTEEWLETDMIVESCNKLMARQAVTHIWEAIDETVIWSKIAKRCAELGHEGCRKAFDPEYMGSDLPYWNNMEELLNANLKNTGFTWDELKKKAPVEYMSEKEYRSYYIYRKTDPETGKPKGFPTPSKKCELYLESMITLGRTGKPFAHCELPPASHDYDPLPYYLEPFESPLPGSEMAKEFPLVMTNGRLPYFHYGTLRNTPYTREIYPAPEVWINPADAEKYGIEDNEWVWVESQRGRVRGIANITAGIGRGAVYMERYWAPENLNKETHGWKEMNVNVLARSRAPYNDVFGTYTLRGYLVKVYKAEEGAPEGVWLEPKEFRSWLPQPSDRTPDITKEERS